jgi:uncharacterized SAM-binding protein YcdF (DUF218 family)
MSMDILKKRVICFVFTILVLLLLLHAQWLPICGNILVVNDKLSRSDVIIVLGTDTKSAREDWAAILYKKGLGKKIIMCGYELGGQTSTAEIMKKHALYLGIPEDAIILDYGWNNNGTWDNAINSLKIVKEKNFKTAIVVTSPYHTRRSRYAFNKVFKNQNVTILISARPGGSFALGGWWRNRELTKTVFLEYIKLKLSDFLCKNPTMYSESNVFRENEIPSNR